MVRARRKNSVINRNEPPSLLKNFGPNGNAILIDLVGAKWNRSAIGARVTVPTGKLRQTEEVRRWRQLRFAE